MATLASSNVRIVGDKSELGDTALDCAVEVVSGDVDVFLLLKGQIDVKAEVEKLEKQLKKITAEKEALEKRMADTARYAKVPADVQQKERERLVAIEKETATIRSSVETFKRLA